jgi:hypothetical protein
MTWGMGLCMKMSFYRSMDGLMDGSRSLVEVSEGHGHCRRGGEGSSLGFSLVHRTIPHIARRSSGTAQYHLHQTLSSCRCIRLSL